MTSQIPLVIGRIPGEIPPWIFWLLIAPYFFLILLGQLAFIVMLLKKLFGRSLSIMVTKQKIICALYGAIGGFLILFTYEIYNPQVLAGPFWGDLPAALLSGFYQDLSPISRGAHFLSWQYLAPFIILGFLGGWGLGQLIDTLILLFKKR